ncbi:hypothetical protein Y919_11200 [Caloranaerobacter azorensis H53214]|uniref:DUF4176 domain-containing protein n=1 Tax=Caloranaerobacter azorensis H53214 TaxID=1156417 RepID=A0A096DK00_9FIRM|nr:DUF4176 domain-containing protein [Caloranaerobacter azorensis]KGG79581.1 hypothetical protein Y919_11200 [Caloranaerobacter azorensis H53214]
MTLLPIGTIVLLKGFEKKIMIFGRKINRIQENKIYDYLGCFYPEGYIGDNYNIFFMHNSIDKIYFKGYEDSKEKIFRLQL